MSANKSVLISYLERNKKVEIPSSKPPHVTDISYLESIFKSLFLFESNVKLCITFQRYDCDWDEFVDLEIDDAINDKDKLKAIVSPLLGQQASSVSVSALTPSIAITPSPSEKPSSLNLSPSLDPPTPLTQLLGAVDQLTNTPPTRTPSNAFRKRKRIIDSDDDNDSKSPDIMCSVDVKFPSMSDTSSSGSIAVFQTPKKDKEVILPNPFPLPKNFTPDVEMAIKTKEVGRLTRNSFISSILHCIYQHKKYPTERDYCNLSSQIMKDFPVFFSSQDALIEIMKNKMKEIRRPKSSSRSVTKSSAPTKLGRLPGSTTKSKDGKFPGKERKPQSSLEVPAGEDDVSFKRHNRVLKTEYVKSRPNMHLVSELMNLTFPMRRADILENPCDINGILDKYPFLQTDILLVDFDLICSTQASIKELDFGMKLFLLGPKVSKIAEIESRSRSSFSNSYKLIFDQFSKKEQVDNSTVSMLKTLLLLIHLLPDSHTKPNPDLLILFSEGATDVLSIAQDCHNKHPYIIVVGALTDPQQAFLVVDKVIIKEIEINFLLKSLLAAFFVFNICYPKGLVNFFTFFEVYLLGLSQKYASPSVKLMLGHMK